MLVNARTLTFFFEENAALGYHDRYVTIYVALSFIIEEADGDIGITNACLQGHAEYSLGNYYTALSEPQNCVEDCADETPAHLWPGTAQGAKSPGWNEQHSARVGNVLL